MVSCAACGCTSSTKTKASGITFHSFPKNELQRNLWLTFLNKPGFEVKQSSVLCSQHFADDCFDRTSLVKVRLRSDAEPVIKVDRLKYVRNYNPILLTPVEQICETPPTPTPTSGCLPLEDHSEDIPRKKLLRRKIDEMQRKDILKNKKIRKLQKVIWHQKCQISSLKSIIAALKMKNQLLEEEN